MRKAQVYQQGQYAGLLEELERNHYRFSYAPGYRGEPVSLAMPVQSKAYEFDKFPAIFEGLLPEGLRLEALLRQHKLDRDDCFAQLLLIGSDVVGSLAIKEAQ